MKTIKFFAALLLIACLCSTNLLAFSTKDDGITMTSSTKSKSVVVKLGNVSKEEISVKIEDANGYTLLTETVKKNKDFIKKYNFTKLADGAYNMIITKTTIRTTQPFTINNGELKMYTADKKEENLPTLKFSNNKFDVGILLKDYSKITVNVFDIDGIMLVNDTHNNVFQLNKRYNLTNLPSGHYYAVIKAGAETFQYDIDIVK